MYLLIYMFSIISHRDKLHKKVVHTGVIFIGDLGMEIPFKTGHSFRSFRGDHVVDTTLFIPSSIVTSSKVMMLLGMSIVTS